MTVWRALRALRAERPRAAAAPIPEDGAAPMEAAPAVRVPSVRSTAWLLRKPVEKQAPKEQAFLTALLPACPALAEAKRLGDDFVRILREQDSAGFDAWLVAAEQSELRSFATGIQRDEAAVRAAITSPWTNGQVEGQVHRIKMVKRTMYGRAKFDLLRARVLHAA